MEYQRLLFFTSIRAIEHGIHPGTGNGDDAIAVADVLLYVLIMCVVALYVARAVVKRWRD